jgi:diguanylate cyclase (GGDEF)-like protein
MKYIDQLTSLKNRNYLNENIANWNKNTIYPQATIIIDLNQVRNINDTLGYEQGDAQIKAAANVLIKTQLDNTDIMRTDGNEYLIYLVGYQEKQVVSYIRKLYKEFKNLPYEHGAAIGYSMITNDMKTIEDSINESVEDMRTKKEELEEIKRWLEKNYSTSLKSVSFLLYQGHGFDQAPYETITKERYEEIESKTKPINSIEIKETDVLDSFECAGGACPVK